MAWYWFEPFCWLHLKNHNQPTCKETPVTLTDAISAVEIANTSFTGSVAQTANDQAAAAVIQSKLDAANATVTSDQQAQTAAASAFNSALDQLIASATAAKIG